MTTLSFQERQRLEAVEGIIFDLQRYSVHDGPGLRTDVFFKGCPLRCGWCSNPESQSLQPEPALFANQCIHCDQFREACPLHWENEHKNGWNQGLEKKYRERVKLCPTGAIRRIGERRTAAEVIAEVLRDLPFYEAGGGMTLTGGDPTMQPDMAEALLRLAKAEG
ncbi:MAG: radical SAM protein, partial [bacterium]|nr:radical SAM protein [bacterium]